MVKLVPRVLRDVFLVVVVFCGAHHAWLMWDDPCNVQPAGNTLTDKGGSVDVPSQCQQGSVWWNYPRGTLQVNFRSDNTQRPFTVCLTPELGPLLSSIGELVNGQQQLVRSPDEGETVCLPVAGTSVTAMLKQPSFQTYMTLYNFTLHYQ